MSFCVILVGGVTQDFVNVKNVPRLKKVGKHWFSLSHRLAKPVLRLLESVLVPTPKRGLFVQPQPSEFSCKPGFVIVVAHPGACWYTAVQR